MRPIILLFLLFVFSCQKDAPEPIQADISLDPPEVSTSGVTVSGRLTGGELGGPARVAVSWYPTYGEPLPGAIRFSDTLMADQSGRFEIILNRDILANTLYEVDALVLQTDGPVQAPASTTFRSSEALRSPFTILTSEEVGVLSGYWWRSSSGVQLGNGLTVQDIDTTTWQPGPSRWSLPDTDAVRDFVSTYPGAVEIWYADEHRILLLASCQGSTSNCDRRLGQLTLPDSTFTDLGALPIPLGPRLVVVDELIFRSTEGTWHRRALQPGLPVLGMAQPPQPAGEVISVPGPRGQVNGIRARYDPNTHSVAVALFTDIDVQPSTGNGLLVRYDFEDDSWVELSSLPDGIRPNALSWLIWDDDVAVVSSAGHPCWRYTHATRSWDCLGWTPTYRQDLPVNGPLSWDRRSQVLTGRALMDNRLKRFVLRFDLDDLVPLE